MTEKEELRYKVEDALSALVQAGHGDQAVTGSLLARRGLIECVRDQLASWVEGLR